MRKYIWKLNSMTDRKQFDNDHQTLASGKGENTLGKVSRPISQTREKLSKGQRSNQ